MKKKVHTIEGWPTPADQVQLKSFLVLAAYYRRFVKAFSSIAALFFRLLQQDCIQTFRRSLTESPVLAPPDPTLPFILDRYVVTGRVRWRKVVVYFNQVLNKRTDAPVSRDEGS